MIVYIVRTDYMTSGIYGIYSSMRRAQLAMEHFLNEDENIVSIESNDAYAYIFHTKNGEQFGVEIMYDIVDYEFDMKKIEE